MNAMFFRPTILLATVLTLGQARAAEPVAPAHPMPAPARTTLERELGRQIDRHVTYPILAREKRMDGDVLVTFVVDAQGKVEVISAYSENQELCEYVLRKLAKVDIGENPGGTWKTTSMRFRFRPEV